MLVMVIASYVTKVRKAAINYSMSDHIENGEHAPRWRPMHGFGVLGMWAAFRLSAAGYLRRDPNRNAYEYAAQSPGELQRAKAQAQEAAEDRQHSPYIYSISFEIIDARGNFRQLSTTQTDDLFEQVTGPRRHPSYQEQWDELRFLPNNDGDDDNADLEITFTSLPQAERNHYDILWAASDDLAHCLAAVGLHDVEPSYVELEIFDRRDANAKRAPEMNAEYELLQTAWRTAHTVHSLADVNW